MSSPNANTDDDQMLDVSALVLICCNSFDEHGEMIANVAKQIFMVAEWLIDNSELMAQFIVLYQEEQKQYGFRICAAVSFWIRNFPSHFDQSNSALCSLVDRFKAMVTRDGSVDDHLINELDLSSVPSYAWLRNVSVRNPVSRHLSLSFEQWSPEDLANAISYIDYRVLSRVTISEVKKYVKVSKLRQTPILERSIAVFNSISCWVQCMILNKASAEERAKVITKFVTVGKQLQKQGNFNTLMAVIGGVTHSSISRLTKTQALLNVPVKKELLNLTELLSTSNNFANYRKALKDSKCCTRIPIMGIHLKDLIAWSNTAHIDFNKTGKILRKHLIQLANLLSFFIGVNRLAPTLFADSNMDLTNTLKVSFDISYNEDDIYDLSIKREPRTLLNNTKQTPVVFADWASGVCQTPDLETVNKHISAMVDAVFKHYDNDRDAHISRSEFQQIAGNFPFLDSFVKIDVDRDGQISKSEMKAYFLELNKQSAEFRSGFRHNFQETTFLTPSICAHCKKMLWGLIRQGLKCRDCSLIVHESCKNSAIAECRRPRNTSTSSCGSNTVPESARSTRSTISMGNFYEWLFNSPSNFSFHHHHNHNGNSTPTHRNGFGQNFHHESPTTVPSPQLTTNRLKTRTTSSPANDGCDTKLDPILLSVSNNGESAPLDGFFGVRSTFRSSFHRLIRSTKKCRSYSDTVDSRDMKCGNANPSSSTDHTNPENPASLASEEVFCDDDDFLYYNTDNSVGNYACSTNINTKELSSTRFTESKNEQSNNRNSTDETNSKLQKIPKTNEKFKQNSKSIAITTITTSGPLEVNKTAQSFPPFSTLCSSLPKQSTLKDEK